MVKGRAMIGSGQELGFQVSSQGKRSNDYPGQLECPVCWENSMSWDRKVSSGMARLCRGPFPLTDVAPGATAQGCAAGADAQATVVPWWESHFCVFIRTKSRQVSVRCLVLTKAPYYVSFPANGSLEEECLFPVCAEAPADALAVSLSLSLSLPLPSPLPKISQQVLGWGNKTIFESCFKFTEKLQR